MSIEDFKIAFEELENIDIQNEYAYEKAIWKYLTVIELPILVYTLPKNSIIFRSRTHDKEDFFHKISDISIVPAEFVTDFGRCNRPFQPVFYSSEDRFTSYAELIENWAESKKDVDTVYVTIGKWILKNDLDLILVTSPDKEKRISKFDKIHGESLDNYLARYNETERSRLIEIYRFLFDLYRQPTKDNKLIYLLTTAYANISLMRDETKAFGVYYPSVPYKFQGVNFAISKSFISNDNLQLIDALRNKFTVSVMPDGRPRFIDVENIDAKYVNIDNNEIVWSNNGR